MRQYRLKFNSLDVPEIKCTNVVIGTIYNDDAIYDNETLVTPATAKEGHHIDILCNVIPYELERYVINPKSPVHSFLGY